MKCIKQVMKLSAIALFPCISANAYEATSQANVYLLNPDEATSISLVNIDNLLDSSKLDGSYIHIVNRQIVQLAITVFLIDQLLIILYILKTLSNFQKQWLITT